MYEMPSVNLVFQIKIIPLIVFIIILSQNKLYLIFLFTVSIKAVEYFTVWFKFKLIFRFIIIKLPSY